MKTKLNNWKKGEMFLFAFIVISVFDNIKGEGTPSFMPTSSSFGCIQFNDQGRPFALTTNTDSLHRLYFHISSTTEKVYFGFARDASSPATSGTFDIKNPSGTIVYASTALPSSGTGFISSYSQAIAGPKIAGLPAGGYTPFTFTPATTGDFYMEFTSNSNQNYRFTYFDLTVKNSSGVTINGRLWSYAWDLNAYTQNNPWTGSFYVYTTDGYVTKVNLNGIQPWGFVVLSNKTGTGVTGNVSADRKSVASDSEYPLYKVFVNNPDSTVYPSGTTPVITTPPSIIGGIIYYGQPVSFSVGVSSPGLFQIFISINESPVISNVIVSGNVTAGTDTLVWNGRDSAGNFPKEGSVITITTEYSVGVTHLPIWDPETNDEGGFIINRIRPVSSSVFVRWDDTGISGTQNLSGGSGNSHQWALNFGNNMTMNTWWDGFDVIDSNEFTLTVTSPLPIELVSFTAKLFDNNSKVTLNWTTASQINNSYFSIEKTTDNINFELVGKAKSAGTSDQLINYSLIDESPYPGISYYRLKQTDFNGNSQAFYLVEVKNIGDDVNSNLFSMYPNPCNGNDINLLLKNCDVGENFRITIYDLKGEQVSDKNFIINDSGVLVYPISECYIIKPGIYFVTGNSNKKSYSARLIIN
jgi:hypothetical protein